jgi:hypothetical protein
MHATITSASREEFAAGAKRVNLLNEDFMADRGVLSNARNLLLR